jgi:hypothetical protein
MERKQPAWLDELCKQFRNVCIELIDREKRFQGPTVCTSWKEYFCWSCVWNLEKVAEENLKKSRLSFKRFKMEDLFIHRRNESNDSNVYGMVWYGIKWVKFKS